MGTNYYAFPKPLTMSKERHTQNAMKGVGKRVHIGKSSMGWAFLFNHNNWEYFKPTRESINKFLKNSVIVDEYGQPYALEEFWRLVDGKQEGLDFDRYLEEWDTIHPGEPCPYNGNEMYEYNIDGFRFSTSTEFF